MTSTTEHMADGRSERRITGRTVLIWLIGFFSVIFAVNGVFLHLALNSFPGVVSETSYEDGLAYNDEIAAARAQAARDWSVAGAVERSADGQAAVEVVAKDKAGNPLVGLLVTARLIRPASPEAARVLVLQEGELGRYGGTLSNLAAGRWILDLDARKGDDTATFRSRNRIFLSERD